MAVVAAEMAVAVEEIVEVVAVVMMVEEVITLSNGFIDILFNSMLS